jgi:integrase
MYEAQKKAERGIVDKDQMTISAFLALWLKEVVSSKKEKTQRTYAYIVNTCIVPHIGDVKLVKLTPAHVMHMLGKNTHLSGTTRHYIRAVLVTALNQAMKWEYLDRNVASLVDAPAKDEFEGYPLSEEEEAALLAVAGRNRILYYVAIRTGLRKSEMIALKWDDLDFEKGTLFVRSGKTEGSRGKIGISPKVMAMLQEHKSTSESEYVFSKPDGSKMHPDVLWAQFKRHVKAAGLPDHIRFHDLRHTCATRLLEKEVNPRVVMQILRHTNVYTTMNIYSHVGANVTKEALEKLD